MTRGCSLSSVASRPTESSSAATLASTSGCWQIAEMHLPKQSFKHQQSADALKLACLSSLLTMQHLPHCIWRKGLAAM